MKKKVPQFLQPVIWSVKIAELDIQKDKILIINQVLAFGGLKELKWLFKTYSSRTIKKVFLEHPIKTYRPAAFNFVKEILLNLEKKALVKEKYVINTPRLIRQKEKSSL